MEQEIKKRGRSKGSTKKNQKKPEQSLELRYALNLAQQSRFAKLESIMHEWTGTHWQSIETKAATRNAWDWLVSTEPKQVSKRKAESCAESAVVPMCELGERSGRRTLVPCKSYMLEVLENGELVKHKHDKSFGNTYVINADLRDSGKAELFTKFIETSLPDPEVRRLVQEYVGYTLVPDCRFEVGQFWYGEGENGKSVLAQIVSELHGSGMKTARLDQLSGFLLQQLVGASLVACDETPSKGINDQTIKTLISGNPILVDRKNKDPISIKIRAKWIVNTNNVPVTEQTHAWWRRWHVIPWSAIIREEDKVYNLAEKVIDNELDYVLKWAIEGLQRLVQRGRFEVPAAAQEHKSKIELLADSVKAFCAEFELVGSAEGSVKSSVYKQYTEWCGENGVRPLSAGNFWKRVESIAKRSGIEICTFRIGQKPRRVSIQFVDKVEGGENDCVPF